jgi:hypothetical protein
MQLGHLRPKHITKGLFLEESVSSDADRTLAGYQKTGDLITLPYTEEVLSEQPFASTVERVAPFITAVWKGSVSLNPEQDNWFETEIAPILILNENGNYDAVLASVGNNLGTVWNAWQVTWGGEPQLREMLWHAGWGNAGGRGRGERRQGPPWDWQQREDDDGDDD